MKPAHMKSTTYKENNKGDPKFEDTQHKIYNKSRFKKNNLRWDTSEFANVDEWDIDKLKTVSVDLSKLSNVVNSDVKKTEYDKLVTKDNAIDTSEFVLIICSTAK